MNYKTNYEPNELLIENLWVNSNFQLPGPGSVSEDYEEICFVTDEIELPVLVAGYRNGIFPWFCEDDGNPVLWQSPNPRFVIDMEELHIPKMIDCQAYTDNMARYGAKEISREEYLKKAKKYQRIRIKGFSKESGK